MMLYKNTKTDFFNICCWSFARRYIITIFVYYLPGLHTLKINRCNKRKWLFAKKKKQESEILIDADYADDQVLLANTPAQAKIQLHNLQQVVQSIGHYMNAQSTCVLN